MLPNASIAVEQYKTKFADLRLAFLNSAAVSTEVVVVQSLALLNEIGKYTSSTVLCLV